MHMQRNSMEASSEASYCERETWDDWGSRSSLSHVEEFERCDSMAGTRTLSSEPPRSTAYYYADLERLKRKSPEENSDELSEYVIANEVVNDIPAREVPPLRDRQWSLPEYSTPENSRKGETYSTAGTFPMPEPKEKEPLLAELEVVGQLPLSQLDSSSGIRRSRSWYLCCPNVGEEEISRDSSWRYSSLRPVTVPPLPGQNGLSMVATQSSRTDDVSSLRAERDALSRALSAERARAASAARAHDARLAELHGVIAELVRRRAQDKHAGAIPEEDVSDECESTTQPAGELDNDADRSRTEQNDSSSILSPCELPTPQEKVDTLPDDSTDTSSHDVQIRLEQPRLEVLAPPTEHDCDVSLNLSEKDSDVCLSTRCCEAAMDAGASSCEREHGSADAHRVYTASPGRCESRQAKIASRVKLKRTEDNCNNHISNNISNHEAWCNEAAERLALDVCAQADLREALVAANNDGEALSATLNAWKLRCSRLQADCAVLQCALSRAADTAHRLYCACCVQESACVGACLALRAADRALEAYDVLLALAETEHGGHTPEREAAELIAGGLLARLEEGPTWNVGSPLLSPGPWLQHAPANVSSRWDSSREARLREHAAALKAETVALRPTTKPELFSYHDIDEEEIPKSVVTCSMAEMEAAVVMQEVLTAKEAIATAHANSLQKNKHTNLQSNITKIHKEHIKDTCNFKEHKNETTRSRRRARERHWLETQASETDL